MGPRRPAALAYAAALFLVAVAAASFSYASGFVPTAVARGGHVREHGSLGYESWKAAGPRAAGNPSAVVRAAELGEDAVAPSRPMLTWAAAALCILASTASKRAAAQRRTSLVACHMYPTACGRAKQKILRRLDPFGGVPSLSTRKLVKRRLIQPWRKNPTRRPGAYKLQLLEKQRVRFHYNVKDKQLGVYMRRAFRKGVHFPVDNFLQQLESRLDNFVWRVGLAPTMAAARCFVRQGHMQLQHGEMTHWRTEVVPSIRLKVGDRVRVSDREASQNHANFYKGTKKEPRNFSIPSHIRWDPETREGEYLDICDRRDIGLDVKERLIVLWYSGQRGLRRTHFRYFAGSMRIIKKRYGGPRIRPTPENILNMKRGIGLNTRGRRRPPCLWGRKKPLNSPYSR
mmetsp:Transcript_102266/g.288929  ORF Transcript_102266/g.288929 Transcript_102266/m.288929 type:complete len:400 (+) Transcript_102266:96-1295(+)